MHNTRHHTHMKKTAATIISSTLALSFLAMAPVFAEGAEQEAPPAPSTNVRGMPMRPGTVMQRVEDRRMQGVGTFGGKVTAVNAPSFTLELPAVDGRAMTTMTVVTNASTTFMLAKATASLADVAVGQYAMVMGRFSTSTQTIVAARVGLSTTAPDGKLRATIEEKRPLMRMGTSTAPGFAIREQVMQRVIGQFSTSTTPDVLREIINSVFSNFTRLLGR